MKKVVRRTLGILVSTFALLETVLQVGSVDEGYRILFADMISIEKPYTIEHWQQTYANYHNEDFWKVDSIYGGYDAQLGWNIFPNRATANGLYKSNNHGLRDNDDCAIAKDSSVFRIGVFGDSFTHGNDVKNNEAWPHLLDSILRAKGVNVEVLNFGVMSYGIDQAYLKYKEHGYKFNCDLVVFGFQAENIFRSQNAFRPNYIPQAGIPLSKPVATLTGDELQWHNIPTMHPKMLLDSVVKDFKNSSLAQFEYYDDHRLVSTSIIDKFYAILAIKSIIKRISGGAKNRTNIAEAQKAWDVSQEIIKQFKIQAEANGSEFMVVQLPNRSDLEEYKSKGELHYEALLNNLKNTFGLLRSDQMLTGQETDKVIAQHYTPLGNSLLAAYFADAIFENYAARPR